MTLVTIAEARENLPDLLRRVAAGEQIVITEGDKWLAALTPPPVPLVAWSAEDEDARQARIKAAIQTMVRQQIADGNPPPADSKVWELLVEEEAARQARAEAFVRECLKLKQDAPLPIPEGMNHEDYFAQYQEQE